MDGPGKVISPTPLKKQFSTPSASVSEGVIRLLPAGDVALPPEVAIVIGRICAAEVGPEVRWS